MAIEQVDVIEQQHAQLSPSEVKRNLILLILLNSTYWTGWAEVQIALQPLLVYLKASNTLIGITNGAPFMGLLGVFLSPWITKRFKFKKKYLFFVNVPFLGTFLLTALIVIFSALMGISNPHLLTVVVGLAILHWLFGGFCGLPAQEYVAACIPMNYRGRLTGYSFFVGGSAAISLALLAGWILNNVPKPACFGYVMLMAWVIMQLGYVCALFAKELPTVSQCTQRPWSIAAIKSVFTDKPYVRFVLLYFLYSVTINQVYVFLNIYGFKQLQMAAATAAIMAMVTQAARISTSFMLGTIVDKFSPKRVLPYAFIISATALFLPTIFENSYGLYISIGLFTVYTVLVSCCQSPLFLGLPSSQNRVGHYSFQLLLQNSALALGPIFTGYLCDLFPFRTVFFSIGFLCVLFIPFSKWILRALPADSKEYS